MCQIMTSKELMKNEDKLYQYDFIEVKDNDESVGIYVSLKYAEEIKHFVDELCMKEEK